MMNQANGVMWRSPMKGSKTCDITTFRVADLDFRIGDCVQMINPESTDAFKPENFLIAKIHGIQELIDFGVKFVSVNVKWYLRPHELPGKRPGVEFSDVDVIEDEARGIVCTEDVDRFVGKCVIIEDYVQSDPLALIKDVTGHEAFVCRFKWTGDDALEPLFVGKERGGFENTPKKESVSSLKERGNIQNTFPFNSPVSVVLNRVTTEEQKTARHKTPGVVYSDHCEELKENVSKQSPSKHNYSSVSMSSDRSPFCSNPPREGRKRPHKQIFVIREDEISSSSDTTPETEKTKGRDKKRGASTPSSCKEKLPIRKTTMKSKSCDTTDGAEKEEKLPAMRVNNRGKESPDEMPRILVEKSRRSWRRIVTPVKYADEFSEKYERGGNLGSPDANVKSSKCASKREMKENKTPRKSLCKEFKPEVNTEEATPKRSSRPPKTAKALSDDEIDEKEVAKLKLDADLASGSEMDPPRKTRRQSVRSRRACDYRETSDDEWVPSMKHTGSSSQSTAQSASVSSSAKRRMSSDTDDEEFKSRRCVRTPQTPRLAGTPGRPKRIRTPSCRFLETEGTTRTPSTPSRRLVTEITPNKTPSRKTGRTPMKTPRNLKPAMAERVISLPETPSSLDAVRANLHVSAVPLSLPCREEEFQNIYAFVEGKISDAVGGCMYISGMPGTGKTATVHAVVRRLEQEVEAGKLPAFQYIEVNGLRLTEPRQVYVRILQQLTGDKRTPQQAQAALAKRFTSGSGHNKTVLLLVDEVDMLRNRRQDVVYNLFDWPSKPRSRFIVLTIANTMDLPERLLMGRVTSRLGLTRLTFQPYNFKQLQEIVTARLQGSKTFNPEAVQLVARKVAAVSGDARRALDICRRSTELLVNEHDCVTMTVVNTALKQMMSSASVRTIRSCSRLEKLFLEAVTSEMKRTGVEETNFYSVYRQFKAACNYHGIKVPNISQSLGILNRLGSSRILLTEHARGDIMQNVCLNISSDDIHYALNNTAAA